MKNDASAVGAAGRSLATTVGAFNRLYTVTATASGWRGIVFALLLGASAVGALPPIHFLPVLIPAFAGLLWMIEGRRGWRQAFVTGWLFGLGYFTAGLYWIANALLTKPEQFGWLAPFAVLAVAALQALFPGMAAALTRISGARGAGCVLVFAGAWTSCEWIRSWAFSGFPWNLIGSVWTVSDGMIQITAVIGTYGLGLLTVASAAMPSVIAGDRARRMRSWAAVACGLAALLVIWVGGILRLQVADEVETVAGVRLRLVQPAIPQNLKWKGELLDRHLATQMRMGIGPADEAPTHVIWGETAASLFLGEDAERRAVIGEFTPPEGLTITGTLRRSPPGAPFRVWNSLQAVDGKGDIVATYDKSHLVPFGEYVPFRSVLNFAKVTAGTTDFSSGSGRTTLRLPGLPAVSPLICYEIIFPGHVVDRQDRPDWLLNLTNDGWYGRSSGPYQHFAAARLRAVEEGLPLVRAANNGISAIVDPYGRVVAQLGLDAKGVVDGPLPRPLLTPTVYARMGSWLVLMVVVAAVGMGLLISRFE